MDDDWPNCDAEAVVAALSVRYRFSRANAVQLLCGKDPRFRYLLQGGDEDEEEREHHDWVSPALAVRVLSVHYRFSGANAVQLLRDGRIHHDCGPRSTRLKRNSSQAQSQREALSLSLLQREFRWFGCKKRLISFEF